MNDLKSLSALTALNDMLAKDWFDICTIDKVARLLEVNPKGEAYDILSPLHCIQYSRMPPILRSAIPDLIRQCLNMPPIYKFTIEEIVGPPKRRLLGLFKS